MTLINSVPHKKQDAGNPFARLSLLAFAVFVFAGSDLPAAGVGEGYTKVEYVEATGSQYVDSGIVPKVNTRVVCKMAFTSAPTANDRPRMGWGSNNSKEAVLWGVGSDGKFGACFSMSWTYSSTGVASDTEVHVFDLQNGSQKFDGTQFGTESTLTSSAGSTSTMYLFAMHTEWSPYADYYFKARIYECRFYEGDTLVRELVPVKRDSDAVAGFYDTVGGTFFTSKSGSLTAGPVCGFSIEAVSDQLWTPGVESRPTLTIVDEADGTVFTSEEIAEYFEIAYANNTLPGSATATVTGREGTAYEGMSLSVNFTISDELLVNGGFESGALAPGWSGTGGVNQNGDIYNPSTDIITGIYCGRIQMSEYIEQIFTNAVSISATLSWKFQHRTSYNPDVAMYYNVLLDGVQIHNEPGFTGSTVYTRTVEDIVLEPGEHTIKFQGWTDNNADSTFFLDQVSFKTTGLPPSFAILPIGKALCYGAAVEPEVTVSNTVDHVLFMAAEIAEYFDIVYANNTRPGTATVTVRGKTGTDFAGQSVSANFILLGVEGLYQKQFGFKSREVDPSDGGTVVPGALLASCAGTSYTYGDTTYTMGTDCMWAYKGVMWMEGGVTYRFVKSYYESAELNITDFSSGNVVQLLLLEQPEVLIYATYTPPQDGYYPIFLAVYNGTGTAGPRNQPFNNADQLGAGLAWTTDSGVSDCTVENFDRWRKFMNTEGEAPLFFTADPTPEDYVILPIPDQEVIGGAAIEPSVTVSNLLTGVTRTIIAGEESDFDVFYRNNRSSGAASVILVGKAGTDFEGAVMRSEFTVTGSSDFYLAGGDEAGASSLSGLNSPGGWSLTDGGMRDVTALSAGDRFFVTTNCPAGLPVTNRTPSVNWAYVTPVGSSLTVCSNAAFAVQIDTPEQYAITLNNLGVQAGAKFSIVPNAGTVNRSLGGNWTVEKAGVVEFLANGSASQPEFTGSIAGAGTIRFTNGGTSVGADSDSARTQRIAGNLSAFTGDVVVRGEDGAVPYLTLELAGENALPADPIAPEKAKVSVLNGAVLMIDQDWTAEVTREWDFGNGEPATINVADGKTVWLKGDVAAPKGFYKKGAGTLILGDRGRFKFIGECFITSTQIRSIYHSGMAVILQ